MAKDDGRVAVCFRFDETLHRQLTEATKQSLRSLNSEILYRVKTTFDQKSDEAAAS